MLWFFSPIKTLPCVDLYAENFIIGLEGFPVDGDDWIFRLTSIYVFHLGNGSIILMHNGAKYTPAALEAIILGLKEQGYELVPISELIHTENYEMDHEGRQHVKKESGTTDGGNASQQPTAETTNAPQTTGTGMPSPAPAATPATTPNLISKNIKKETPMPQHAA